MPCPKRILAPLLFFAVILFLTASASAATMSFTLRSGETVTRTLDLAVEDHVTVIVTVGGQSDSVIDFYVTFPNGTVKDFGKVGYLDYRFVCDSKGEYVLHFSNADSTLEKQVTLNYEVQPYILGVPQMFFLVIIIAVICVAAMAVFVLMGRRL